MHALRRRNWILECPDADVCGNRSTDAKIISSQSRAAEAQIDASVSKVATFPRLVQVYAPYH